MCKQHHRARQALLKADAAREGHRYSRTTLWVCSWAIAGLAATGVSTRAPRQAGGRFRVVCVPQGTCDAHQIMDAGPCLKGCTDHQEKHAHGEHPDKDAQAGAHVRAVLVPPAMYREIRKHDPPA
jgi:hypothetical protein